jgi:hypothetical protein
MHSSAKIQGALIIFFLTAIICFPMPVIGQATIPGDHLSRPGAGGAGYYDLTQPPYPDVRLTYNSASSVKPRAVVDGTYLYVVWEDSRDGNVEAYWQKFERDTVNPATAPVRLSNTSDQSVDPCIGVDGSGNSYVVWLENPPYGVVYGSKIGPDGTVIIQPIAVSPGLTSSPEIGVTSTGIVWVVFERKAPTDQDVYVRRFDDQFNQQCETRLNAGTLPAISKNPSVVAPEDGNAFVAWRDLTPSWQDGIFRATINSSCGVIGSDMFIAGEYQYPSLGWAGGFAWMVAWKDWNVYNLYGPPGVAAQINDIPGTADPRPRVGDNPNHAYVVWHDTHDGNPEIYLSRAYGNQSFSDVRLTENPASSENPDIAMRNAEPGEWWVVWQDTRVGNSEIYLTGPSVVPPPLCGDADANGVVDIDDIIYLINYVYLGGPEPVHWESGDVNCDGKIDMLDIVYLARYMFRGGPAPCDPDGNGIPDC